jgi:short-subunit dehydrogenase
VLCPGPIKSNIHELERNRPARFAPSEAFVASAKRLGQRQVSSLWMDPEEVGKMILKAVLNDTLYVITHGEWRPAVMARMDAILVAMPEKVNPELIATLRPPEREE